MAARKSQVRIMALFSFFILNHLWRGITCTPSGEKDREEKPATSKKGCKGSRVSGRGLDFATARMLKGIVKEMENTGNLFCLLIGGTS